MQMAASPTPDIQLLTIVLASNSHTFATSTEATENSPGFPGMAFEGLSRVVCIQFAEDGDPQPRLQYLS